MEKISWDRIALIAVAVLIGGFIIAKAVFFIVETRVAVVSNTSRINAIERQLNPINNIPEEK